MGDMGLVPIPVDQVGNTRLIESDLDEDTLQAIARLTGGQYFRSTDGGIFVQPTVPIWNVPTSRSTVWNDPPLNVLTARNGVMSLVG